MGKHYEQLSEPTWCDNGYMAIGCAEPDYQRHGSPDVSSVIANVYPAHHADGVRPEDVERCERTARLFWQAPKMLAAVREFGRIFSEITEALSKAKNPNLQSALDAVLKNDPTYQNLCEVRGALESFLEVFDR